MPRKPQTITERFWDRVDIRGPDDCWDWLGCKEKSGCGVIGTTDCFTMSAQKFSYLLHNMPAKGIPAEQFVTQTCGRAACVNPAHLVIGKRKVRPV